MSAASNSKSQTSAQEPGVKVKTTGQLRDFLVNMMLGVKNGHLDLDRASRITKLAQQVNESMYAEIKTARLRAEAGEAMPKIGQMSIGAQET